MIIPAINIKRRKIIEYEELENYSSGPIWIIDNDAKMGKEMNIAIYDDLAGQYDLYVDGEFRHRDDVADAITMGASRVTISEKMDRRNIVESLFMTENIIFFYRGNQEKLNFFLHEKGQYIYSDIEVESQGLSLFTKNLKCEKCNIIVEISECNGGRN